MIISLGNSLRVILKCSTPTNMLFSIGVSHFPDPKLQFLRFFDIYPTNYAIISLANGFIINLTCSTLTNTMFSVGVDNFPGPKLRFFRTLVTSNFCIVGLTNYIIMQLNH